VQQCIVLTDSILHVGDSLLALYLPSLGPSPPNGLGTVPSPIGGETPPGALSILFPVGAILGPANINNESTPRPLVKTHPSQSFQ